MLLAPGVSQHQDFVGPAKMECRSGRTCYQSASWSLSAAVPRCSLTHRTTGRPFIAYGDVLGKHLASRAKNRWELKRLLERASTHEHSICFPRVPALPPLFRPVTPEVAGSSPVAPVKVPANEHLLLPVLGETDRPLLRIPRTSRTGNRRLVPLGAGNPRKGDDRPHRRASSGSGMPDAGHCSGFA